METKRTSGPARDRERKCRRARLAGAVSAFHRAWSAGLLSVQRGWDAASRVAYGALIALSSRSAISAGAKRSQAEGAKHG
jgi:hypothetical protein